MLTQPFLAKRKGKDESHVNRIRQDRTTRYIFDAIEQKRTQDAEDRERRKKLHEKEEAEKEAKGLKEGQRLWKRAPHKVLADDIREGQHIYKYIWPIVLFIFRGALTIPRLPQAHNKQPVIRQGSI